ncbi:MAG: metallophosphoesterase [Acidobacteria bacterium]|nr:metallophosphoesterase [Acidobacteriota bacterium]
MSVQLPNLPEPWRGRVAALVSDTHLGHVRGRRFLHRIVKLLRRTQPDVVFLAGDIYDGTAADCDRLAEPLRELKPPLGVYYVTGNHEEFTDRSKYMRAIARTGVRLLNNEKLELDGLQIVGMHYSESVNRDMFRAVLNRVALDRSRPVVLLKHSPDRLKMSEQAAISLVLCGHTHGGQFFPFTRITKHIYGQFVHGLNRIGNLVVFTSVGAGTWGPPLRIGPNPEIVLIRFENSYAQQPGTL